MGITRRFFIGMIGGAVVVRPTLAAWESLPQSPIAPSVVRSVRSISLWAHESGTFQVRRSPGDSVDNTLLLLPCGKGGVAYWNAVPDEYLCLRPNEPLFSIIGPPCDWEISWTEGNDTWAAIKRGSEEVRTCKCNT